MRDDSLALARVWLDYIERDRVIAERLLIDVPGGAAYHVQQAAEKSLKAAIALSGIEPPRTHDLVRLAALAAPVLDWTQDAAWLAEVSSWVATTRYPTDIPNPLPDQEVVAQALRITERLIDEVRSKLA